MTNNIFGSASAAMMVVDDMRTLHLIRMLSNPGAQAGTGENSRKRAARDDDEPIRKKVRFLSEIVSRTFPSRENGASASVTVPGGEGDQTVPEQVMNNDVAVVAPVGSLECPPVSLAPRRRLSNRKCHEFTSMKVSSRDALRYSKTCCLIVFHSGEGKTSGDAGGPYH